MISEEIKSQIDRIWDVCWSGGISNPLEVIENSYPAGIREVAA